ncbi:MAG: hypothetical protein QXK66_04150 [Sulfolobales archaeon]
MPTSCSKRLRDVEGVCLETDRCDRKALPEKMSKTLKNTRVVVRREAVDALVKALSG